MMGKRLFVLLIIPMLLIPMAALGFAHFSDEAVKKYKLHIKYPDIEIGSYKVLSKYDDCLIKKWLDGNTLNIQTKVFPGWFAWVGLILHNSGDQPVEVGPPSYNVYDPNNVWQYFTHKEYFYGPYDRGEFATADPLVWDGLKWWQLPPTVTPTPPPIMLEHCHKIVLWIKLKFTSTPLSRCCCKFTIRISINVPLTQELTEISSYTWPPT